MSKSRLCGDKFEFAIAKYFVDKGYIFYDDKTREKFNKLADKLKNLIFDNDYAHIFEKENLNIYNKIKFTEDKDG